MPEQLREDVSRALRTFLERWLYDQLARSADPVMVATALDIPIFPTPQQSQESFILNYARQGDEQLLDAVHATLHVLGTGNRTFSRPPHEARPRHGDLS
jgi:hypothetical protein